MSRTFWTKLNHDDARLAIDMMDDAEIGRWFRGWLAGAGGKEYPTEKIASWPVEMRTGFRAGCESAEEAARYSQKQRDRVSSRYRGRATEDHGSTTEQSGSEKSTETLPSNSQQLTSNIQQPTTNSEKPKKARQAAFSPSMFDRMIPAQLASQPAFMAAWHEWMESRHEKRKPISERAAKSQLEFLAGLGMASMAVASIKNSIKNDYQGLFPPKEERRSNQGFGALTPERNTREYHEQGRVVDEFGMF